MALSVLLPTLARNSAQNQQIQPTEVPIPTFPPPIVDLNTIQFDELYLHPSGLFTVAQPTGWFPTEPLTTIDNARVTMSNVNQQSVLQVDVDKPASNGALTLDDVDARFTSAALASSWSRYNTWKETGARRRENDRLLMDFELTLNKQTFVARQVAWTDGEWIYSVRVVTPENATDELLYVLDKTASTLTPNKEFATTPFDWKAYFDAQDSHIIRFPSNWVLADSAPGKPTSITSGDEIALRVETASGAINDEDAARAWVEDVRPGASILSVEPVTRDDGNGFSVAYAFKNIDGESQSGLAVLLNGAEDKLHIANIRFNGADVDLNTDAGKEAYGNLASVMSTFTVLPEINLAPATAPVS
jgi:hypothetical protein